VLQTTGIGQRVREFMLEMLPIDPPGQRIVLRQIADVQFGTLAFGVVDPDRENHHRIFGTTSEA
jgi:hypothetical protein